MSLALTGYKSVLSHLPIPNVVEFHKVVVELIEPHVQGVTGLGVRFNKYKADVAALMEEYSQRSKSIETAIIVVKDEKRDLTGTYYLNTIDYYSKNTQNEAEAAAIYKLKFVADTYRNAPKKDYTAEIAALRSLIRDSRKLAAEVALFGLGKILDKLEHENNDFEEHYITRTLESEEKREHGPLTNYKIKVNESFDAMVQYLNGLYLTQDLVPESKDDLLQIISILRGQIHAYSIIYHRHRGLSSKKKDNNDNGPSDPQNPDITDPPAPGTDPGPFPEPEDPENPDIENPPPPPFLPDFE
ncbi:hypothetical protein FACS1894181_14710 [Bacteroidia bacterium]|nr:hypothetical protein FACS1894181_14710 [Bacteroidia bacterium]